MTRNKDDFIPIGNNNRIILPDLTGRYQQAINVDELLAPLLPLWQAIETHCVAACCGLDAFDFETDALYAVASKLEPDTLNHALQDAIEHISLLDTTVVSSTYLNNLVDKQAFITLLQHIKASVPQREN